MGVMTALGAAFAIIFIALAVLGYVPGAFPFVVLSLLLLLYRRPHILGKLPTSNWLFRISLAIIVGCALTLLPLPYALMGAKRVGPFLRAETLSYQLAAVEPAENRNEKVPSFLSFLVHGTIDAFRHESEPNTPSPSFHSPQRVRASLTLNRAGTIRTLFLVTGFFCCFWLCAGSTEKQKRRVIIFLIGLGTVCALTGIISRWFFPQGKTILWFYPITDGKPIGPFINRNHFAFYCALLVPACLLLVTQKRLPLGESQMPRRALTGHLEKLFSLVCGLILVLGVIVSLSRSGFLVLIGCVCMALAHTAAKRFSQALIIIVLVSLIGVGVYQLPFESFQSRISTLKEPFQTASAQTRLNVWKDALNILRDYPVLGVGSDAFQVVYPMYKTSLSRKGASHAENEYVQILADNGLIGGGLVGAAIILFALAVAKGLFKPQDKSTDTFFFTGTALSVLAGCAVHACLSFGLRIPLNALTVACLLGCGYITVPNDNSELSNEAEAKGSSGGGPRLNRLVGVLFVFFAVLTNYYWLAAWKMDQYTFLQTRSAETQMKAIAWAPTYWYPWYETGTRCLDMGAGSLIKDKTKQKLSRQLGYECVKTAALLNSSDYRIWMAMAQVAFQQGDVSAADKAAKRVIKLRPYRKEQVEQFLQNRENE